MTVYVLNYRETKPANIEVFDTTTRSKTFARNLSPMIVGPVHGNQSKSWNVENLWQFSKVYPEHVDNNGDPTEFYFSWRNKGYSDKWAHRYPMGKNVKPLYSLWDNQKLNYIEARKNIYIPKYSEAVKTTEAYQELQTEYKRLGEIVLLDFDAYNHRDLGMTYTDVANCESKKMGHAFVLAMMLEGVL